MESKPKANSASYRAWRSILWLFPWSNPRSAISNRTHRYGPRNHFFFPSQLEAWWWLWRRYSCFRFFSPAELWIFRWRGTCLLSRWAKRQSNSWAYRHPLSSRIGCSRSRETFQYHLAWFPKTGRYRIERRSAPILRWSPTHPDCWWRCLLSCQHFDNWNIVWPGKLFKK